jgi:hypothetical protein
MKQAFLTLLLMCSYAHLSAQQPSGLPMGATDLIPDNRFETYEIESHVIETILLSESFVPTQDANAWSLENLTFDDALEIESSPQSSKFANSYESFLAALSKYKTQLKSLQEPLNRIKKGMTQYAEGV